jgi:hypothetical protein
MAEDKDKAQEASRAPARGKATELATRPSTPEHEDVPDALGEEIEKRPATLDPPVPEDQQIGAGGMALSRGEVGGGNIKAVLEAPEALDAVPRAMAKEQAAMISKIGQKIGGLIGRPVTEWGVIGPGEIVRGHMLLLDLNSGEKVRAMDGHRVGKGELYMNLRNVPEALATGDTIDKVLGA